MKDFANKLNTIIDKYKNIEKELSLQNNLNKENLIKLNKEYAELTPLVETIRDFNKCKNNIQDLIDLSQDNDALIRNEADEELKPRSG